MPNNEKRKFAYSPDIKMQGFRKWVTAREFKEYLNFYNITEEEQIRVLIQQFRERGYSGTYQSILSKRIQRDNHEGMIRTTLGWVEPENPRIIEWLKTGFIRELEL